MRILFIAPLPPPVTGQAFASSVFLRHLEARHSVTVVNYHKGVLDPGITVRRIGEVMGIFSRIRRARREADAIYFTITQSFAGNLKDLLIFMACWRKLPQTVIHLHGGVLKQHLFDRHPLLALCNRIFLRRVGACAVLGESLRENFRGLVPPERVHVVPNFAEEGVFLEEHAIRRKFDSMVPLRILFLSNLLGGKGHEELVEACRGLSPDLRGRIQVDIAGGFVSPSQGESFLAGIRDIPFLQYRGIVSGMEKRRLLAEAHLLCLPTYYRFEGQPIVLLEGYASGCAVITTDHAGIRDIFAPGENGIEVRKGDVASLRNAIETAVDRPGDLLPVALRNAAKARDGYRERGFCEALSRILEKVGGGVQPGEGA